MVLLFSPQNPDLKALAAVIRPPMKLGIALRGNFVAYDETEA